MGSLPHWWKGKKILEHYSGFEYYEYDYRIRKQEGKLVDKQNYDSVTDLERVKAIQRRLG